MNTVNKEEIKKFSHQDWWNYNSLESKMLHRLNVLRMKFLQNLCEIDGKTVLDIGCGGGIASESLARCGASVTGIDASMEAVECAKNHANEGNLKIDYHNTPIEKFESPYKFEIVFANDIIEHVENPAEFLKIAGEKVQKNGLFIISTINKNPASLLLAKFAAEYVLKVVPKGTHDFAKFVRPNFIQKTLKNEFSHIKTQGFSYNPITKAMFFEPTALANYFIVLQKK